MVKSKEDPWFLQIDGDKHKAVSAEDVIQGLMTGTVLITHRVSRDGLNWKAVCNEVYFENLIRKIIKQITRDSVPEGKSRKQGTSSEHTLTSFRNLSQVRKGIPEQLAEAEKLSKLNFDVSALRKVLNSIAVNKKKVVKVELKTVETLHPDDASEYILGPTKPQTIKWKLNRLSFGIIIACILTFAGQQVYFSIDRHDNKNKKNGDSLTRDSKDSRILAEYDKILGISDKLTESHPSKDPDSDALLDAEEAALTDPRNPKSSGTNVATDLHNAAIARLNKEQFRAAEPLLLKSMTLGGNGPTAVLALSEVAVGLEGHAPEKHFERLGRVDQLLESSARDYPDFKAEILVAQIRSAALKKETDQAERLIREFLNINPESVPAKTLDPIWNRERVGWNNIYSWCLQIYSVMSQEPLSSALIAGCLVQIHKGTEAVAFARYAARSLPQDHLVKGIYAYSLFAAGRDSEVRQVTGNGSDLTMSKLAFISLAHVCQRQNDWTCAGKAWKTVYTMDSKDASALEGMASYYYRIGHYREARKVIREGISRNPASQGLKQIANKLLSKGVGL